MVRVGGRTIVPVLFFYFSACSKKMKQKPKTLFWGEEMKLYSEEKCETAKRYWGKGPKFEFHF